MLISCAAYQNGKKLGDIAESEINQYVSRPDCFVWVALREPDPGKLQEMQKAFHLHPLAVEDANHGHQAPKIEEYGDSLFVVVKMLEFDAQGDLTVGEVDIFVGPNYVLSVRRNAQRGFRDVRDRTEREPHLLRHGSSYVLYALMDSAVDRYFPVLNALEMELEQIEQRIFDGGNARGNLKDLYGLKQKLVTMKHTVAPLMEAVGKLYGGRVPQVCSNLQDYFRDIGDHLQRLNQTIDAVRDMVVTAISVNLSMITLEESQTMKRLAAWAALVAVPTMIAGIYGMNFSHMPELDWKFGYPLALTLMAGIDAYLYRKLRKAGWL